MANLIISNPLILTEQDIEDWGLIDLNEFAKAQEFIKSKLSAEDYAELRDKHNFDIHPLESAGSFKD